MHIKQATAGAFEVRGQDDNNGYLGEEQTHRSNADVMVVVHWNVQNL